MYIVFIILFIYLSDTNGINTKPSSSKYKNNIPLFWKIASRNEFYTNTPKKIIFNGFPIAIYKDNNNTINAISDICVHRGASLSRGKILNNKKTHARSCNNK